MKNFKNIPLYLSILFFAVSLTQKSYCVSQNDCAEGYLSFLTGPLGVFYGGACLTWFANPLLFFSWVAYKNDTIISAIVSLLATAISFSFLFFDTIVASEAPTYSKITFYDVGYWLWLSSCVIILFCNGYKIFINNKTKENIKAV